MYSKIHTIQIKLSSINTSINTIIADYSTVLYYSNSYSYITSKIPQLVYFSDSEKSSVPELR